jgi:hypothetical protein
VIAAVAQQNVVRRDINSPYAGQADIWLNEATPQTSHWTLTCHVVRR